VTQTEWILGGCLAVFAIIIELLVIVIYMKSREFNMSRVMATALTAHVMLWILIIVGFVAYLINSSIFTPTAEAIEGTGFGVVIKAILGIIIGIWFSSPGIVAMVEG
jgi:hypothetical protein